MIHMLGLSKDIGKSNNLRNSESLIHLIIFEGLINFSKQTLIVFEAIISLDQLIK